MADFSPDVALPSKRGAGRIGVGPLADGGGALNTARLGPDGGGSGDGGGSLRSSAYTCGRGGAG